MHSNYSVRLSLIPRLSCRTHPQSLLALNTRMTRTITTTPSHNKNPQFPPRPTLPDSEIKHVYLKGSGPGGQKINKTSSAVQLTHLPTGIVVKSQATRSQSQNHTIARRLLAEKIEFLEKGATSRVALKEERARKKKASSVKKSRRKYKKLEEARERGHGSVPTALDAGAVADGIGKESLSAEGEGEEDAHEWDDEDEIDDYRNAREEEEQTIQAQQQDTSAMDDSMPVSGKHGK